jgi:hypothetical protein
LDLRMLLLPSRNSAAHTGWMHRPRTRPGGIMSNPNVYPKVNRNVNGNINPGPRLSVGAVWADRSGDID